MPTEIILASASPRRTELLSQLGVQFLVLPADVDETIDDTLSPAEMVRELARRKATAIADQYPDSLVLGADTLVAYQQHVLGKPDDAAHALQMLRLLNGQCHQVHTGIALICQTQRVMVVKSESTDVFFRHVDEGLLKRYVATGEPMDKAGAYAIQGYGATLVERVCGCYNNVVGLPTALLCRELEALGIPLLPEYGSRG
ncbi:MAG: Maf family protein [Armatimonadota bacterium]